MHPRDAAQTLYKKLLKFYDEKIFVDAVSCRGENFLVVYIEDTDTGGLRVIDSWEGYRVLYRKLSTIFDFENCQR
jgi:hypothetical protein